MKQGTLARRAQQLMDMYDAMRAALGLRGWWPAETPFEVVVGAILTQNAGWHNVTLALDRLRERKALSPSAMWRMARPELEEAIRPSGYFRRKAQRLYDFLSFLKAKGGLDGGVASMELRCLEPLATACLRRELLSVRGIGPETADSILLYALGRPSFVVDAYTSRILSRHGLVPEDIPYDELRAFFMDCLPEDTALYNDFHAQLVRAGHDYCKKSTPACGQCPLQRFLEYAPAL